MKMLLPLNRMLDFLSSTAKIEPSVSVPTATEAQNDKGFVPPSGNLDGIVGFITAHGAICHRPQTTRAIGVIEFKDVKFSYPSDLRRVVLTGVTFTVSKGQKIGICGSAGAGKSTAIYLLQVHAIRHTPWAIGCYLVACSHVTVAAAIRRRPLWWCRLH